MPKNNYTELDNLVIEFEEYLDKYHSFAKINTYPWSSAQWHVLLAYDLSANKARLDETSGKHPAQLVQDSRLFREGFIHACRWLSERNQNGGLEPTNYLQEILNAADELIEFGSWYSLIGDQFRMYWKRDIDAELSGVSLDFLYFADRDIYPIALAQEGVLEMERVSNPDHEVSADRDLLILSYLKIEHRLVEGRIEITGLDMLPVAKARSVFEQYYDFENFFEVKSSLGEFSLSEFLDCWIALRTWSECALYLFYVYFERGIGPEECMPTQLVYRKRLEHQLSRLSGLNRGTVEAIIETLIYSNTPQSRDSIISPLFSFGDHIGWSAWSILISRQPRNIMKLFARSETKREIAAGIIGARETAFASSLSSYFLERYGWRTDSFIGLGGEGEIDLVVWSGEEPSKALIIEIKVILQADEMNEVYAATEALKVGQGQVVRAISWLSNNVPSKASGIPFSSIDRYLGMVLTPDTAPSTTFEIGETPAVSWAILEKALQDASCKVPTDLHQVAMDISRIPAVARSETMLRRVRVGERSYGLPYYEVLEGSDVVNTVPPEYVETIASFDFGH